VDLLRDGALADLIAVTHPHVALHAAGLTNVDGCEANEPLALRLHAAAARELATAALAVSASPVLISTDHLWRGTVPLVAEDAPLQPMNAYARTKAAGEREFLAAAPGALVLRTNFFGPGRPWRQSLSDWIAGKLKAGEPVKAFDDVFFTPIALPYMTAAIAALVAGGAKGIFNLAGSERVSKFAFARRFCDANGMDCDLIQHASVADAALQAPRPRDMSLSTDKIAAFLGRKMPSLDESLRILAKE
jgi:dTDP-4-dehydrorhamnose reductase